jgi:hypothetical protein
VGKIQSDGLDLEGFGIEKTTKRAGPAGSTSDSGGGRFLRQQRGFFVWSVGFEMYWGDHE